MGVVLAALALIACETTAPTVSASNSKIAEPSQSVQALARVRTALKVGAPEKVKTPQKLENPKKEKNLQPPVKTYPALEDMTGLERRVLISLLGEPGFMRRDAPAEIWQYKTLACTLDVFLYKDAVGPTYRVAHFETRGGAPTTMDCVVSVFRAAHYKPTG